MDSSGAGGVDLRVEGESCCARSVGLPACCVVACALVGRNAAPECDAGGVCMRQATTTTWM